VKILQRIEVFVAGMSLLMFVLAASNCARSSGGAAAQEEVVTVTALLADPLRERVYVSDAEGEGVDTLSTRTGDVVDEFLANQKVSGLAIDECGTRLYAALPLDRSIQVLRVDDGVIEQEVRLNSAPNRLLLRNASSLIVVTQRAVLDVDVSSGERTVLEQPIDPQALIALSRNGEALYILGQGGPSPLIRLDLSEPADSTPRRTFPAFTSKAVSIALSYDESELYLGTVNDGVLVLDANNLSLQQRIDLPAGLRAMAINPTGTRLYYTLDTPAIHSISLFDHAAGETRSLAESVKEGGLLVGADGLSLVTLGESESVITRLAFDVTLEGSSAWAEGLHPLTVTGKPGATYVVLVAYEPGYTFLDPPGTPEPRFLDLRPDITYQAYEGRLDPSGQDTRSHNFLNRPHLHGLRVVAQAVTVDPAGGVDEVSNPLLITLLGAACED
jgi:hypothetical protein